MGYPPYSACAEFRLQPEGISERTLIHEKRRIRVCPAPGFLQWKRTAKVPHGQGTPGILRCSLNSGIDLHARNEPSSPVIANVKCGTPLLLIDDRHVRTSGDSAPIPITVVLNWIAGLTK